MDSSESKIDQNFTFMEKFNLLMKLREIREMAAFTTQLHILHDQ